MANPGTSLLILSSIVLSLLFSSYLSIPCPGEGIPLLLIDGAVAWDESKSLQFLYSAAISGAWASRSLMSLRAEMARPVITPRPASYS